MEREIRNKTIVVTGGAQGIGLQITKSFLKAEAKLVILLDINEEEGIKAAKELVSHFGQNKVVYMKCNVVEDLEEIYQKIYNEFGIIDVLINNAGFVDEIVAKNCIDVNLTATVQWSLKFMELMRQDVEGNGGTIINIACIFGYRTSYFAPVYNASKFGVVGFTKAFGHESRYNKKKVRVIALCPGLTNTAMMKKIQAEEPKALVEHINTNCQWQSAEEVAEKAVEIFKIAESGSLWEIEGGVVMERK